MEEHTTTNMDSHYEQVMRRRADAERAGAPPRLYFAYSTVLDPAAFAEWREQHGYGFFSLPPGTVAQARDVALVYDFPSHWWGGRVAGLEDRPGTHVWGRLYQIAAADWPILAHKEGAVTGMCVERQVRVRAGDGEVVATAFTTRPERRSLQGPVSGRFVAALRRGAEAAGLPADWVASLAAPAEPT